MPKGVLGAASFGTIAVAAGTLGDGGGGEKGMDNVVIMTTMDEDVTPADCQPPQSITGKISQILMPDPKQQKECKDHLILILVIILSF